MRTFWERFSFSFAGEFVFLQLDKSCQIWAKSNLCSTFFQSKKYRSLCPQNVLTIFNMICINHSTLTNIFCWNNLSNFFCMIWVCKLRLLFYWMIDKISIFRSFNRSQKILISNFFIDQLGNRWLFDLDFQTQPNFNRLSIP